MERAKGIEPSSNAWQALVLPLNHARNIGELFGELFPQESPLSSVTARGIFRRKPDSSVPHQHALARSRSTIEPHPRDSTILPKSAQEGTRTLKPFGIRTSSVRVCQFHHLGEKRYLNWRCGRDSNPRNTVLQTAPLDHSGTAPKTEQGGFYQIPWSTYEAESKTWRTR